MGCAFWLIGGNPSCTKITLIGQEENAINPSTEPKAAPDGDDAKVGKIHVIIDLIISKPIAASNVPFNSERRRCCMRGNIQKIHKNNKKLAVMEIAKPISVQTGLSHSMLSNPSVLTIVACAEPATDVRVMVTISAISKPMRAKSHEHNGK